MELLTTGEADIRRAADGIKAGLLVAFPTETVYGLGADAFNQVALARVFAAKGRPRFDPLIIHIASLETLDRLADLSALTPLMREKAAALMARFWPGPLTLILPKKPEVPDLATSGLPSVAVRCPDHPAALELIRLSTGAVAAPSANPFGRLSPTKAEHVRDQLGDRVDFILDGGRTSVGVESTVLDLSGGSSPAAAAPVPRILRPGGLSREAIEAVIGPVEFLAPGFSASEAAGISDPTAFTPGQSGPVSPGQLKSHYAPITPLVLYSPEAMASLAYSPGELFIFFSPKSRDSWLAVQNRTFPKDLIWTLSDSGSTLDGAANLFDLLHKLDRLEAAYIRVEAAPPYELGPAINDRLSRASTL
ncbi:Sua5/YciO/YrdC/YwlC family protein [Treponema primitia ZAS-2]|uniref:Threonylcarbamoyl-AMP synthase n=1 Tax=Treponema primitia (strain ATCC BAA-887 / DSM 12427 / ZAS-2) TaxID=545694 RepID=F5YLE7_TREPZ|nr:L-threonylcarbamoyladenylate synthase [Treponema primitia]AEF84159.1 Sua5/YciO/YrdC/YwlC family protein [Treponema primitia ZAS-2]